MRVPLLLAAAVAALLVGVVAAPVSAKTAKTPKACQLLTAGQVEKVVGEPVGAGKPSSTKLPKGTTQCVFSATGTPGAIFIFQISQGAGVATSYEVGRKSLPSHKLTLGAGIKAYQVNETSSVGLLYKGAYMILQPPGTIAKARDLSALPALAKTAVQAYKAWS
jgi:hypothetical protein